MLAGRLKGGVHYRPYRMPRIAWSAMHLDIGLTEYHGLEQSLLEQACQVKRIKAFALRLLEEH